MKRLVVCFDGTWNNPDQEDNGVTATSNVYKLHNALAERDENGVEQLRFYHPGVGGEDIGKIQELVGGALGKGITRHLCSAYHWLGSHYEEGDEIYIHGFSRGAFTARSLGGFLGLGLLDVSALEPARGWERVHTAFEEGYKEKQPVNDWGASWKFFHGGEAVPVEMIGVWDTVGALGIPDDLEILNFLDNRKEWEWHDTCLGEHVQHGRHAMALDEWRSSFTVARWENCGDHDDAQEKWFPGAHSDVGGGYADSELSNIALLWMIEQCQVLGVAFREEALAHVKSDPLGVLHNSYKGMFKRMRSRPRNIPAVVSRNRAQFHESVFRRQLVSPVDYPSYHPTFRLEPGTSRTFDVYANTRWNETGIFLTAGHEYRFSASGEWRSGKEACDWRGLSDGKFSLGDVLRGASSLLGRFESLVPANESADFLGTKRVEHFDWFVAVGAIANDSGAGSSVTNDGSPVPHQYVNLSEFENTSLKLRKSGYLHCFPNDAWSLYEGNRGSIQVTVTRLS